MLFGHPAGVDTRALTKRIREKGTLLGKLVPDSVPSQNVPFDDPNKRPLVKAVSLQASGGGGVGQAGGPEADLAPGGG